MLVFKINLKEEVNKLGFTSLTCELEDEVTKDFNQLNCLVSLSCLTETLIYEL
jgi:hypothetical protein